MQINHFVADTKIDFSIGNKLHKHAVMMQLILFMIQLIIYYTAEPLIGLELFLYFL